MYILTSEGGWLGPLIFIFGKLMNGIFLVLEKFGIGNIGLAIIIFTIITRLILHPFTLQQQKSSKMMAIIQPEIQAVQKKYEGKQDQASMMQQQQEIKAVYEKYGTSMTGSCLQLAIQMPIIFALYRVIMNIPAYVDRIKDHFEVIVNAMVQDIGNVDGLCTKIQEFANSEQYAKTLKPILSQVKNLGYTYQKSFDTYIKMEKITEGAQKDYIIDFLYKLNPNQIKELGEKIGANTQNIMEVETKIIDELNGFCGMNLATAPSINGFSFTMMNAAGKSVFNIYLLIPILAFLTQFLSSKLMQVSQKNKLNQQEEDNTMASSMKTMMITMPIVSAVFTWGFPTGLGLYWIASAGILCLQQLVINMQLKNIDMDKLIKQNIEKANKKRAKKGLAPLDTNVTVNSIKKQVEKEEEKAKARENILKAQATKEANSQQFYFGDEANPDSLFAKANMVKKYNEKHQDK